MRQAQARKPFDAYLEAPKRSERPHLHVVEDLREEAPYVDVPEWAEPFADPRWDDSLGGAQEEERDGRRTVIVTGRPGMRHQPRRDRSVGATARMRGYTPTRARLAGRPDRVALWAVALALIMAAIAGFSGNSHTSSIPTQPAPASVLDR
jgi:hypothetical protein